MAGNGMKPHILWTERKTLSLLDQRALPSELVYRECSQPGDVASAIRDMIVRGAPAIGIAGAYGMALSARENASAANRRNFCKGIKQDAALLKAARPTAVNLPWAVDRLLNLALDLSRNGADPEDVATAMEEEALQIHADDVKACKAMGQHALRFIPGRASILTHCNAGALATGGYGTALGVVRAAQEAGRHVRVFADETRPYLQGSRLTAWEMREEGIPVTVLCDSSAATLMAEGQVDLVVVGADRIAANGDTANKVGTFPLAVLAARFGLPFLVAAPRSTFDPKSPDGRAIVIEQRPEEEVLRMGGRTVAPEGVPAFNPAFDVTPHELIRAIVTEDGPISPVNAESVGEFLTKGHS
jgi:methylthioribose-1-phosphate isomerase